MTRATAFLHQRGILHLDIKPDNILYDHNPGDPLPNFYLGDFGIARAEADAVGTNKIGTPLFMAPELAFGLAKPGPAADIWSFAMTIGEALGFWCLMNWTSWLHAGHGQRSSRSLAASSRLLKRPFG